jgi:hypothetical protein
MWDQLLQREVVVTLAVIGAAAATLGAWLRGRGTSPAVGLAVYWGGYAITGISVALFILAGLWGAGP